MSKPTNTNGMSCPLWRKPCSKVCHTCEFWDHIRGKHPQTGQDIDHWSCVWKLQTMLSIENTMAVRQTTATVDAFRGEVHKANDVGIVGAINHLNQTMLEKRVAAIGRDAEASASMRLIAG